MKRRLILGKRDIFVLNALHLHGALNSRQLTELCFPDVSHETSRKRLRKLRQSGYIDAAAMNNKEEKGRPEHAFFLNINAAGALARNKDISEETIIVGPPNANHKEHLARLVELHLAWQRTAKQEKLSHFDFFTKRVCESTKNGHPEMNAAQRHADATIIFSKQEGSSQTILVVLETGNLRQTRHWLPKMNALLKANLPILIVALNEKRLDVLRQWTLPILDKAEIEHERCLFGLYDQVVSHGFLYANTYCTKGNAIKISV